MPNKRGGVKINGGGVKINGGELSEKVNATKQGSHDTTGRACCGARFLTGNSRQKCTRARVLEVLIEHLLFLLWLVIHYRTCKINKRGSSIKLRGGWEKNRKIDKRWGRLFDT